ncbi:protein FAM76A-like isoform X2 [Dysidea avara]|uniref:protein FAM76A-like isoform X2 n=1 Tax=Dysidea avara TaxID=196820 RepID=UPI00332F2B89
MIMTSITNRQGVENLFACTSCHGKHSYDELSHNEQLCKTCRKRYPRVQCRYCHLDYHKMDDSSSKRNMCKNCYREFKDHGEPSVCEYCKLRSAFNSNKCNRCKHSEGRYGEPVSCDHCQMKCAFIKQDQVDGMTLCLMCTLRYKKTRHQLTSSNYDYDIISSRDKPPANKKQRLSIPTTTRLSASITQSSHDLVTTSLPVASQSETFFTDHQTVEVEQLRDQVTNLKKQLTAKDQLIIEKEKQMCQLRAEGWEQVKELRHKLQTVQKAHSEQVDNLQGTIRQLQKQLSQQHSSKITRPQPTPPPSNKDTIF